MRTRASRITAAIVLLTCVVCPVVELFDFWDKTMQTGTDTEYAFVFLALCVGLLYSFAGIISKFFLDLPAVEAASCAAEKPSFHFLLSAAVARVLIPISPPALSLSLRI
ncbi:MAG: hypothetical protein ACRD4S_12080 [Candidatus Acidiferrales bacterium]